jgi:hypothetical protein
LFERLPLVVEPPRDISALHAAAAVAAQHWELPPPALIRVGSNGVFACGDVILRVGLATAPVDVALRLAERLLSARLLVPRPARADAVHVGELWVSAWERVEVVADATIDWSAIGEMVATVHALDPTSVDHPLPFCGDFPWWSFDTLIEGVPESDRRVLLPVIERNRWWVEAARSGPLVVCHGDVHPGNVLVTAHGPVLMDWDLLCLGPREWDHSMLRTYATRWGGPPEAYDAFTSGYGRRLDGPLLDAIAEMRNLAATLMRLRRAPADPAAAEEAERRMQHWRGDPVAPIWRAQ